MVVYEYRCPDGHVTELELPMADEKPESVVCGHVPEKRIRVDWTDEETRTQGCVVVTLDGDEVAKSRFSGDTCGERIGAAMKRVGAAAAPPPCGLPASRVWAPWAATIYHGAGTYTNDYKLKYDRKRRKNSADGLPLPSEAAITRAEGAEYDPPKRLPGGIIR